MANEKVAQIDGTMSLAEIKAAARKEVNDKHNKAAVAKLKALYEQERAAEMALANVRREIKDVEEQIEDGAFRDGVR